MRTAGILLVLLGLSPVGLAGYEMIKGFSALNAGTGTAIDAQLIQRAITLTTFGIPVLAVGIVLQIVAAVRKRRERLAAAGS